jgi:hypothetical protein
LREAVKLDPNFALAHANLGVALLQRGHYAEAAAELRGAQALGADGPYIKQWSYSLRCFKLSSVLAFPLRDTVKTVP